MSVTVYESCAETCVVAIVRSRRFRGVIIVAAGWRAASTSAVLAASSRTLQLPSGAIVADESSIVARPIQR